MNGIAFLKQSREMGLTSRADSEEITARQGQAIPKNRTSMPGRSRVRLPEPFVNQPPVLGQGTGMDSPSYINRRNILTAAAVSAVPLSGLAWTMLTSSLPGQQSRTNNAPAGDSGPLLVDSWNPPVRVNLTPAPLDVITLSIDGPYRVLAPGSPKILGDGDRLPESTVMPVGNAIRVGDTSFAISQVELVPVRSPAIRVGKTLYRGSVRIFRKPGNQLIAVNVLALEDYLASVINSEMPATFPEAARQAQAIVARTYAVAHMKGHPEFDVFATSRSQKYLGHQYTDQNGRLLAGESASGREMAQSTAGIVCTYQNQLFVTYYTAACGGRTINGRTVFTDAVPAVKSVVCDWCREAQRYRWTGALDVASVSQAIRTELKKNGSDFGTLQSLTQEAGIEGDLPYYLVSDGRQTQRMAGTILRSGLPSGLLESPHFTAEVTNNEVRFSGRGHGHGVGFCQWGSRGLAQAGRSTLEILSYYYPGSSTVRLRDSTG